MTGDRTRGGAAITPITQADYAVGDTIEYHAFGGDLRRVRVTEQEADIKNGRPGFAGTMLKADGTRMGEGGVWGYDDQISRIVERAVRS